MNIVRKRSEQFFQMAGAVVLLGYCLGCGHADYKHSLRAQSAFFLPAISP